MKRAFVDGPAFPTFAGAAGMTYREWLIGQALIGLLARPVYIQGAVTHWNAGAFNPEEYAAAAIEAADAVIKRLQ